MKKIILVATAMLCLTTIGILSAACSVSTAQDCVRIHIRANSNTEYDQSLKYKVRDEVITYLSPILQECITKQDAYTVIYNNLEELEVVSNQKLVSLGSDYVATVSLTKERFPARMYGDLVFNQGVYDALIIEIGEGDGDNWWCVAFPPLCFIPEDVQGEDIQYKSKIWELFKERKNG